MGYDTVHLKIMPWIFPELQTFLYLPANGIIQGMRPIIAFNYGAAHHRAGCISALTPDRSDRCLACILNRRSRSCGALADHMPENGGYKLILSITPSRSGIHLPVYGNHSL